MLINKYNFEANHENNIDASNKVDGKAIYYLTGVSDLIIASPAKAIGTVYCFDCSNLTVRGQSLKNNSVGIFLYNTTNCSLENNTIQNNLNCIVFRESKNNTALNENISSNQGDGALIEASKYIMRITNNHAF
jgi:parallel beta-helix repeat protein